MEQTLTFDQLPNAVAMLAKEVSELKRLLIDKHEQLNIEESEKWFDLNDLVNYDPEKRAKSTWYGITSRSEVPYHKRGKKLYFLKSEIDAWLKAGKCKSSSEIEAETKAYLSNNKKGLNNGK